MNREIAAERWQQAGALFHELVELDEASRSDRLSLIGDSDPELRMALEALLAGDAIADVALPALGFGVDAVFTEERGDAFGLEGETFGRFHVLEQIAWGGMGVVYRAEDSQLHRTVAVKFPLLDSDVTESGLARTLREARSAGALDHPNLCPIYEVGESAAGPFLVMPLYRGETLKERLASAAPLAVAEALAIVEQLAAGLGCAHAAGIVHCDIKPGNIMLLGDGTVKLLDFGLARAATDSSRTQGVVGTVHYMAPEQVRNEPVDARADLWAVGVILYEMLTGSRPFTGSGAGAIADSILELDPQPFGAIRPPVPAAAQELVSALLQKHAAERLQTAAELTRAVIAARNRISSRPPGFRMRRLGVAGGVLLGASMLASALWLRSPPTLIESGRLTLRDTLILADFEVAGLDSGLSPALTTVLRRDFADSKTVSLMPSSGVNAAIGRMRRRPGARLTEELAREIGRREGARAVITSRVSPLASGYLVTLRLTESESGNELASVSSMAAVAERDLLPALARAGGALRRKIGTALRDAKGTPPPDRKLTTTSLEASRLMWSKENARPVQERIVAERAAIRLDSAFAYAWMAIGNQLSWSGYRSVAQDSAFSMAYRFREKLSLMERAQVTSMYWDHVQSDRRRGLAELESALAFDTTLYRAVPLNIAEALIKTRQFERAESFARRIERWPSIALSASSAVARAQLAQGKYVAADSTLARRRSLRGGDDEISLAIAQSIALNALRFDRAELLLKRPARAPDSDPPGYEISYLRLRGRFAEARRMADWHDSVQASIAAAAGARFDPLAGRTLASAREALWRRDDAAAALAHLDSHWRRAPETHDIQDRIDGIQAAALYAAAGRPKKARALLAALEEGADTIARRAIYEHRRATLAEIALAEGRFNEAMRQFRASDLGADALPAATCGVCVLPDLARVAERAGWADSARVFWDAYVNRPAIERLGTDQWFLAAAYRKLAAFTLASGDVTTAARYRAELAELRRETRP